MKTVLTGLYLVLGMLCLFGFPAAFMGLSALLGDQGMKLLHSALSAANSVGFQFEALVIVFSACAIGLATALAAFAGIWLAALAFLRMAEGSAPASAGPAMRAAVSPAVQQELTVGHINHAGSHRRGRAAVA